MVMTMIICVDDGGYDDAVDVDDIVMILLLLLLMLLVLLICEDAGVN